MKTVTLNSIADELVERARESVDRLREDPFFGRLVRGDVDREEYVAWLVQMHKYIRHTVRALKGHALAMAGRAHLDPRQRPLSVSSSRHSEEEDGHDDVILEDLAALWETSVDAARGRVERAETAPAVLDWERLSDGMLARYPVGMIGVGLALETVSTLTADEIRRGLLERSAIPGIERAVEFLRDHSGEVEADHTASARARANALPDPTDRSAIFFYGMAALTMFEGLTRFLNEQGAVERDTRSAAA
jgi:hypothetical protein